MPEIVRRYRYPAQPERVFAALTDPEGLGRWFAVRCEARPRVGSRARFEFGPGEEAAFVVEMLIPTAVVQWRCTESSPDLAAWRGTTVRFELYPRDEGCDLHLRHSGFSQEDDAFARATRRWEHCAGEELEAHLRAGASQTESS